MKTLVAAALILWAFLPIASAAPAPAISEGDVVVVPLEGEISQAQLFFLRRILKEAEREKASGFIIDMDTPGGRVDACIEILKLLLKTNVPTATYVNDDAGSAGALIALGSKRIYMAPVSAIGAASPILGGGQEIPETLNAKTVSYLSGYFRSAAERNGYNPEIAEAFIDKDKSVTIGEKKIHEAGKPLTLSAQQAIEEIGGKPVLASGIAENVEQVAEKAGFKGQIVKVEPSGFEQLAFLITRLAPFFLMGGIVGTYLEMKSPGLGVPGAIAAICFALFFAGHYVAGLTGMEVVAVFILGVLLIVVEIVFFPGVFVFAGVGALLMIGSLLFSMVDTFPGEPIPLDASAWAAPLLNLAAAVVVAFVIITVIARYLPELPLFSRLVLRTSQLSGPSFVPAMPSVTIAPVEPGAEGVALSILRPAGRAQFGAKMVDAEAVGEFVEAGRKVRVLRMEAGRAIVEPV